MGAFDYFFASSSCSSNKKVQAINGSSINDNLALSDEESSFEKISRKDIEEEEENEKYHPSEVAMVKLLGSLTVLYEKDMGKKYVTLQQVFGGFPRQGTPSQIILYQNKIQKLRLQLPGKFEEKRPKKLLKKYEKFGLILIETEKNGLAIQLTNEAAQLVEQRKFLKDLPLIKPSKVESVAKITRNTNTSKKNRVKRPKRVNRIRGLHDSNNRPNCQIILSQLCNQVSTEFPIYPVLQLEKEGQPSLGVKPCDESKENNSNEEYEFIEHDQLY